MGRAQRRADIAAFRREAARVVTYLVDADDPRLARQPLLRNAIAYWRQGVSVRKPRCFGCKAKFADDGEQPGAFLLATPATAPTECAVVGLCVTAGAILIRMRNRNVICGKPCYSCRDASRLQGQRAKPCKLRAGPGCRTAQTLLHQGDAYNEIGAAAPAAGRSWPLSHARFIYWRLARPCCGIRPVVGGAHERS